MRALSQRDARYLLSNLLRDVSRSFYLTLKALPARVRDQIGLAYLLARATDTIADTELLPRDFRLQALERLKEAILGGTVFAAIPKLAEHQQLPAERVLLSRLPDILMLLGAFSDRDQQLIREVLRVIVSGQELDLKRFGSTEPGKITALNDAAELDDYTHRVAGCVGEFWTRICSEHLWQGRSLPVEELVEKGIRFGKGLQLVNILRDLPSDLRTGRCYLPLEELKFAGLSPADLLLSHNEPLVRPVYNRWVAHAEDHLKIGWSYVLGLPRSALRLRLACSWPILIGFETIRRLKMENVLHSAHPIKISRREIRRILRATVLALPFKNRWESLPANFGPETLGKVNRVAR